MKTGIMSKAQCGCANWNVGKCLGANYSISEDGTVYTWVDPDFATKDCKVNDGCEYFDKIVSPSIP